MPPEVRGNPVDDETRCVHWDSQLDVVAFRFPCCQGWWPCRSCHDEATDHQAETWGLEARDTEAVLCGVCKTTMTIEAYLACHHACPGCRARFNPGCQDHWPTYIEIEGP